MTNEEKAKELVDKELNAPITLKNRHQAEISLEGHCEKVALEMAEWKDQQFKEYLEKKRKKYTTGLSVALQKNATQEAVVNDKIQCLLNEIINELF